MAGRSKTPPEAKRAKQRQQIAEGKSKGPGHGGPANPGDRPPRPYEPTHGARSPGLVEPRARELAPAVFEANPHLDPARDGPAVFRYAVNLARIERVYRWLDEQDDEVFADLSEGKAHAVYERLERWEKQASAAEDRLAIAPLTRAKLGLDLARGFDLAREWAKQEGGDGGPR